jgi:hypothetical protein
MASKQNEMLVGYMNDMLAVERELHAVFRRQKEDGRVKRYPDSAALLSRIEDTIDDHLRALSTGIKRLGGDESVLKKAVGAVLGVAGGLYDKVRMDDKVSRMLRDDYTALNFATVCYEMLHTTALALRDEQTADLALAHLKDYTPLIVGLSDEMPRLLIRELTDEGKVPADSGAAEQAARNTRAAWSGASVHQ